MVDANAKKVKSLDDKIRAEIHEEDQQLMKSWLQKLAMLETQPAMVYNLVERLESNPTNQGQGGPVSESYLAMMTNRVSDMSPASFQMKAQYMTK